MNNQTLAQKITETVEKKVDLISKSPIRYFVRAILAVLYLSLATTIAFLVGDTLQKFLIALLGNTPENVTIAFTVAKLAFSFVFGWALVFIVYLNGELFTSNAMYFTSKVFAKEIKVNTWAKVLTLCFLGNLTGAILAAILITSSGTFTVDHSTFAQTVVTAKLAKAPLEIFLQGIIANLTINMAVVLIMNLKDDSAKIRAIIFAVFMFAFFGSEHVIANFTSFSLVAFAAGFDLIPAQPFIINTIFATLGNLVGGGVVIGITYAWLNSIDTKYKD